MPVERTAYTNAPSNRRSLANTACQRSVGLMAEKLVPAPTGVLSDLCAQILNATARLWTDHRWPAPCLGPVMNFTVELSWLSSALRTLSAITFNAFSTSPTIPSHVLGFAGMFGGGNFISPWAAWAPATPSNTNVQARSWALRQVSCGFNSSLPRG